MTRIIGYPHCMARNEAHELICDLAVGPEGRFCTDHTIEPYRHHVAVVHDGNTVTIELAGPDVLACTFSNGGRATLRMELSAYHRLLDHVEKDATDRYAWQKANRAVRAAIGLEERFQNADVVPAPVDFTPSEEPPSGG